MSVWTWWGNALHHATVAIRRFPPTRVLRAIFAGTRFPSTRPASAGTKQGTRFLTLRAPAGLVGRRGIPVAAAAVFALVGVLGLTTDVFRSSRSVVHDALVGLAAPSDVELRVLIDVRADAAVTRESFHHLLFRAGPGPLLRAQRPLPSVQLPFQFVLERRGVRLTFKGSTIVRDGAGYVRITEMPAYGELSKSLEGRWLKVSDVREVPLRVLTKEETSRLIRMVLAPDVLRVRPGKAEDVRDVRTRVYELELNDEKLQALVREFPGTFPEQPGVPAVARFLEGRLQEHRVERAKLWVRPRAHRLVRARVELVPRSTTRTAQRIVLDATFLPIAGATVPEAPPGAVRLRPETLRKLIPR